MKNSIETARLYLHPLTYEQLKLYLQNDGSIEKELNINWKPRDIHPDLRESLQKTLSPEMEDHQNFHFFTLWTMISKEYNCMIGDLCFKGEPCENGSVEIGYGIYPAFERKGYITEAVEVLCLWAMNQKYVRSVRAETLPDNIASQRVLQKNGFVFLGNSNGFMKWQLHSDFMQKAKQNHPHFHY